MQPDFELFEGNKDNIPIGYHQIECHIIFDIKLGENSRRKARLVGGGQKMVAPASITYSYVVSRDSNPHCTNNSRIERSRYSCL